MSERESERDEERERTKEEETRLIISSTLQRIASFSNSTYWPMKSVAVQIVHNNIILSLSLYSISWWRAHLFLTLVITLEPISTHLSFDSTWALISSLFLDCETVYILHNVRGRRKKTSHRLMIFHKYVTFVCLNLKYRLTYESNRLPSVD